MYDVYRDDKTGDQSFTIVLPKENSPLGIHVIPYNSNENQVNGLVLQNIESDGRIKRQGILEINDRIIEINRINIEQCSFEKYRDRSFRKCVIGLSCFFFLELS